MNCVLNLLRVEDKIVNFDAFAKVLKKTQLSTYLFDVIPTANSAYIPRNYDKISHFKLILLQNISYFRMLFELLIIVL